MIRVNLFHRVTVLWSSISRPGVFCSSLLLCGRAVVFVGSVSLSDLRFPLAMGSPCGKSQCLLLCGSPVLSLRAFLDGK